ncbi:hypothetical protein [Nocardioides bizhenqiangii]|uniref:Uncharacterized protein n=1 Tax=Nocardioides bizhenqiangii TaxID=3095076 RepID=A0ABZ0ZTU2_9ACTN|nr:hypothetical protein [Nocardioides sp. HM61]WQQ27663.1 hypothetical protein SHK19_05360 [Nocardioides sp. HM61]
MLQQDGAAAMDDVEMVIRKDNKINFGKIQREILRFTTVESCFRRSAR